MTASASSARPNTGLAKNLARRLMLLRLRMTLVGMAAALILGLGLLYTLDQGFMLRDGLHGAGASGALPPFHIPLQLTRSDQESDGARGKLVVQLALLLVGVAGVGGWSTGRLAGVQRFGWAALLGVLMLFILKAHNADHSLSGFSPSALHTAINQQRWDEAESLVSNVPDTLLRTYVQAQIALHAGDQQGLVQFGQAVVDQVDFLVMTRNRWESSEQLRQANQFEPAVIYSLEMALYGAPRTSVGIALFERQQAGKALPSHARPRWSALAAGIAAMLLGVGGLGLWRQMFRRTNYLQVWSDYGDDHSRPHGLVIKPEMPAGAQPLR